MYIYIVGRLAEVGAISQGLSVVREPLAQWPVSFARRVIDICRIAHCRKWLRGKDRRLVAKASRTISPPPLCVPSCRYLLSIINLRRIESIISIWNRGSNRPTCKSIVSFLFFSSAQWKKRKRDNFLFFELARKNGTETTRLLEWVNSKSIHFFSSIEITTRQIGTIIIALVLVRSRHLSNRLS